MSLDYNFVGEMTGKDIREAAEYKNLLTLH